MEGQTRRPIPFHTQDLALIREGIRRLLENFDEVRPTIKSMGDVDEEDVRELMDALGRPGTAPGRVTVQLSKRQMSVLYHAAFWATEFHDEALAKAGFPGQAQDEMLDRLGALEDEYFPLPSRDQRGSSS